MIFDTDDPRLTAYALDELDPSVREPKSNNSWPTARRPALTSARFARPHHGSRRNCGTNGKLFFPWHNPFMS